MKKIYQTLKTVFVKISNRLGVRQIYSATRRMFNSLLAVWKCGQTRSSVFDILLHAQTFSASLRAVGPLVMGPIVLTSIIVWLVEGVT